MMTCPNTETYEQREQGLVGCGSSNITEPDDEGIIDCLSCGLWFTELEARR